MHLRARVVQSCKVKIAGGVICVLHVRAGATENHHTLKCGFLDKSFIRNGFLRNPHLNSL